MNFTELGLHENLQKGITNAGYETCTPVQEQVLSGACTGEDLYVQSQTGTGKTAAYLITVFQQILTDSTMHGKKALVLVPTRELAVQVEEEAKLLGSETGLSCASFYGGVGYTQQQKELKKGVDIIIGTPGRVIDLQESKTMDLSNVGFLVVDEADRMFDMGFYPDLRKLIKVLPDTQNRQTMLFSATLNSYVKNLAWEYTEDAKEITIECENITVSEIDQMLLHVSSDEKIKLLVGILSNEKPESVIIFCNTKRMSEIVSKRLGINGIQSEFIIGDLPQSKRLQIIDSFKKGELKCLVATDVAARGIDVDDLAMVINFDLPNEAENYVHRIGRTARAGKSGKAYTFCSEQDVYNLPAIERYVEMTIPSSVADDTQMAEDKSAGIYIKTGLYGDEDDDYRGASSRGGRGGRSSRDGRRNGRDGERGNGRERSERGRSGVRTTASGYRESDNRRSGTDGNERRNGERGRNYGASERTRTKGARGANVQNRAYGGKNTLGSTEELSALSFDERMKLYREKYGNGQAEQGGRKKSTQKGGGYTKGNGGSTRDGSENRTFTDKKGAKGAGKNGGYKNGSKDARKPNQAARARNNSNEASFKTNNRGASANRNGQNRADAGKKQSLFGRIKSLFTRN